MNCLLESGKIYLISGESGAGKTTILKMIYGLVKPTKGTMFLVDKDNIYNLHNLSYSSLWKKIAYCEQYTQYDYETLGACIKKSRPQATEKEINKVLEIVGLYTWVLQQSEKYDVLLGHNGNVLSGGQKTRLDVARKLLGLMDDSGEFSGILILDETLDNVDHKTRLDIINNLSKYIGNNKLMIILVSHIGEQILQNTSYVNLKVHNNNIEMMFNTNGAK